MKRLIWIGCVPARRRAAFSEGYGDEEQGGRSPPLGVPRGGGAAKMVLQRSRYDVGPGSTGGSRRGERDALFQCAGRRSGDSH